MVCSFVGNPCLLENGSFSFLKLLMNYHAEVVQKGEDVTHNMFVTT